MYRDELVAGDKKKCLFGAVVRFVTVGPSLKNDPRGCTRYERMLFGGSKAREEIKERRRVPSGIIRKILSKTCFVQCPG